jgi:arsenate reductase-like glutaredoxin family protein
VSVQVQIFGVKNDADTRKALRFFKERRAKIHFNDFKVRSPSKGELRRFAQKFGIDALIDRDAKRFKSLGLHAAHYGEDRWLDIASEEPEILRMPLVRFEGKVTVGADEETWRDWVGK